MSAPRRSARSRAPGSTSTQPSPSPSRSTIGLPSTMTSTARHPASDASSSSSSRNRSQSASRSANGRAPTSTRKSSASGNGRQKGEEGSDGEMDDAEEGAEDEDGEEDFHARPKRSSASKGLVASGASHVQSEAEEEEEDGAGALGLEGMQNDGRVVVDEDEEDDQGVTRCICGSMDEESLGYMVQCETCKCWQHGICMGMPSEEDCPDTYYCELCRPDLHRELLRALGRSTHRKRPNQYTKAREREALAAASAAAHQAASRQRRPSGGASEAASYTTRAGDRKASGSKSSPRDLHFSRQRSASREDDAPNKPPKSPKRRSTMNSRDAAYDAGHWETLPPEILREMEEEERKERGRYKEEGDDPTVKEEGEEADEEMQARKRKRGRREGEEAEQSPEATSPRLSAEVVYFPAEHVKRRRMSAGSASGFNVSVGQHPGGKEAHGKGKGEAIEEAQEESDGEKGKDAEEENSSAAPSRSTAARGKKRKAAVPVSTGGDSSTSAAHVKPKHPNQYTYRNQNKALANGLSSPSKSRSSAAPSERAPMHDHQTRRRAGDANSRTGTPASGEGGRGAGGVGIGPGLGMGWGLPDHLSHLSHLLPAPQPTPLAICLPSPNGNKDPQGEWRLVGRGGGSSSGEGSTRVVINEPCTRIRFPGKRVTLPEMRKRVRNVLEYVTRTQVEAVERGKRLKALGIRVGGTGSVPSPSVTTAAGGGESENEDRVRTSDTPVKEDGADSSEGKEGGALVDAHPMEVDVPSTVDANGESDGPTPDIKPPAMTGTEGDSETAIATNPTGAPTATPVLNGTSGDSTSKTNGANGAVLPVEPTAVTATGGPTSTPDAPKLPDGPTQPTSSADMADSISATPQGASDPAQAQQEPEPPQDDVDDDVPLSMRMMDELTRELIHFQERFGGGGGAGAMSASTAAALAGLSLRAGGGEKAASVTTTGEGD